jgi:predicted kinase
VLEGRLIWTATELLSRGMSAILDFGLWGRDERASLHWLAGALHATAQTVYLEVDPETQLARVTQRWHDAPSGTWEMDLATLNGWRAAFQAPSSDELASSWNPESPDGSMSWRDWLSARWPTSVQ